MGLGLCALVTVVILREIRREYVPVFVAAFTLAVLAMILPKITVAAELIKECAELTKSTRVIPVVKALGITYLTSSAAELCRCCGESSVGSAIPDFSANISIVSL